MPRWNHCIFIGLIGFTRAIALAQDAPKVLSSNDAHPTPITLHVKNETIGKVMEEVTRQSGCKFQIDYQPEVKVTLDADAQPLWSVVSRACDQAHVGLSQGFWNDGAVHLGGGSPVEA